MDGAGGNADTRTRAMIHDVTTPEIEIQHEHTDTIDDWAARAAASLEADFSMVEAKIHRFPRGLRGIGGGGGRYITPSVVAIGPYHHGAPHLEKMEAVKLAAAHYLCRDSAGRSMVNRAYDKVHSVVGAARGCYDADDPSVAGVSDADFAAMMFLDGCFLLQYMVDDDSAAPVLRNRMTLSTGPSIEKDIFLLENQIPWLVLEALMEFVAAAKVRRFVAIMGDKFLPGKAKEARRKQWPQLRWRGISEEIGEHRPPPAHLLGLLRFTQVGFMPASVMNYKCLSVDSSLSISAVELEQMGVRLAPSTAPWFGDMTMHRRRLLFGELSLSPLFLNDVTACWLVNVAAAEASAAGASRDSDGFVVSSYLSVLAMLMDSEADVQQLRAQQLLYSTFSNTQTLNFFKGLAQHLRFGQRYLAVLEMIEAYKRYRAVWIILHKHLYTSFKAMTIATLFSIVGVLVGIFKTLLDNKKH